MLGTTGLTSEHRPIATRSWRKKPAAGSFLSSRIGFVASAPFLFFMGSVAKLARDLRLFRETPVILSGPISSLVGKDVFIKLDALQASGSFKDRGMAHLCHDLKSKGTVKVISSSGGNAGLAVATVGRQLGLHVSVIVPETTKTLVIEKLKSLEADVTVYGANWNAADALARELAEADPTAAYISPYDHPLLWTGHSTVVDEIVDELGKNVGCIVASVGGGGLICGVLEGLARHREGGRSSTVVISAETEGAASFGESWRRGTLVRLDAITSIATSLGALEVTSVALERARAHQESGGLVLSSICTDAEAVSACVQFSQDHRILVEPACGAALAVAYTPRLRDQFLSNLEGPIVIEVCGGSGVSIELLSLWKRDFLAD